MQIAIVKIQSEGYIISTDVPVRLGQSFRFFPSQITGTAITKLSDTDTKYFVTAATTDLTDTAVSQNIWWRPTQPLSSARCVGRNFFTPSDDDCAFLATCTTIPTAHHAGSLGWDLWYAPDSRHPWLHILKGNDLYDRGRCSYTELGSTWPLGNWLFRATMFYQTNLVPVSASAHNFQILTKTDSINFNFNCEFDALL